MEEPPKKKKEQPEYSFRASYDKQKGVKVEISPDGLDEIFEGIGGILQDSKLGNVLFGQEESDEEEESMEPFWSQQIQHDASTMPDLSHIPVPPIKSMEEEEPKDESMDEVPTEPTEKPNWPPGGPYEGDDCEHPNVVLIADPNDWLDLLKMMNYTNIKRDWKDVQGHICAKCLKKVF
jgi:hypothetical protein